MRRLVYFATFLLLFSNIFSVALAGIHYEDDIPENICPFNTVGRNVFNRKKTFRENLKQGLSAEVLFEKFDIPKAVRHFYNQESGAFEYRREEPIRLSLENGEQKLEAVRINFPYLSKSQGVSVEVLKRFKLVLADYVKAMNLVPDFELWISVVPSQIELLNSLIAPLNPEAAQRIRLAPLEQDQTLDIWAQDGSKPIFNQRASLRASSKAPMTMADLRGYLASTKSLEQLGVGIKDSPFPLEGGNTVVGARHVFIGPAEVTKIMELFALSWDEALKVLTIEYGQPIVVLGERVEGKHPQPIHFHIDLDFSIVRDRHTNKEVALLSSPALLIQSLLKVDLMSAERVDFFAAKRKFLKQWSLQNIENRKRMTWQESEFLENFKNWSYKKLILQEAKLFSMEKTLIEAGYEVRRIPGYFNKSPNDESKRKMLNSISYANAIYSDGVAFVPGYGLSFLDPAAWKVVEGLGYKVIPFDSAPQTMSLNGGPRCVSETYRINFSCAQQQ